MLRQSVVAICIVPSPVGPWLRTAGIALRDIRPPPAHGQARTLRGAGRAQGGWRRAAVVTPVAWVSDVRTDKCHRPSGARNGLPGNELRELK